MVVVLIRKDRPTNRNGPRTTKALSFWEIFVCTLCLVVEASHDYHINTPHFSKLETIAYFTLDVLYFLLTFTLVNDSLSGLYPRTPFPHSNIVLSMRSRSWRCDFNYMEELSTSLIDARCDFYSAFHLHVQPLYFGSVAGKADYMKPKTNAGNDVKCVAYS